MTVDKTTGSERLKTLLPEVWRLMKPRRYLLVAGAALMIVNRICGLALPVSTKYLINNVMQHGEMNLLLPIVLTVIAATMVQGITSFFLSQLLSKAGQRLIYELRVRIQEHIGRLPVSFYDSNKTGTLVSRIMSDVEGVRNLLGTGLVELIGGMLTAVISTGPALSHQCQHDHTRTHHCYSLRVGPPARFQNRPPNLSRARQDYCRSHRSPH